MSPVEYALSSSLYIAVCLQIHLNHVAGDAVCMYLGQMTRLLCRKSFIHTALQSVDIVRSAVSTYVMSQQSLTCTSPWL